MPNKSDQSRGQTVQIALEVIEWPEQVLNTKVHEVNNDVCGKTYQVPLKINSHANNGMTIMD